MTHFNVLKKLAMIVDQIEEAWNTLQAREVELLAVNVHDREELSRRIVARDKAHDRLNFMRARYEELESLAICTGAC